MQQRRDDSSAHENKHELQTWHRLGELCTFVTSLRVFTGVCVCVCACIVLSCASDCRTAEQDEEAILLVESQSIAQLCTPLLPWPMTSIIATREYTYHTLAADVLADAGVG